MDVQHGNPVGVRCVSGAGKPTAREAQSPGGKRMAKKRMPVAERRQEPGRWWTLHRRHGELAG